MTIEIEQIVSSVLFGGCAFVEGEKIRLDHQGFYMLDLW